MAMVWQGTGLFIQERTNFESKYYSRSDILLAAGVLQTGGPAVQAEALACLQQLHMFAPTHLDLGTVVPELVALLTSPHLSLRCSWLLVLESIFNPHSQASSSSLLEAIGSTRSKRGQLCFLGFTSLIFLSP